MGEGLKLSDRRQLDHPVEVDRRSGERRTSVRAPIDLWMEESKGNELYFRRSGNLSAGGVYFEQSIPHPLGTRVNLKFTLPGEDYVIETSAEIVNTPEELDGLGMGVRFLELRDADRERIEGFVTASIDGES